MKYTREDKFTKPYTPTDVLRLAMEKEKSSYAFYSEMIKNAESPALIRLLEELKKSEWAHIQAIKQKLEK